MMPKGLVSLGSQVLAFTLALRVLDEMRVSNNLFHKERRKAMSEMNTPRQRKHLARLCEVALEADGFYLTKSEAQRAIGRGGELQKKFRELVLELGKGLFANEEVESNYTYPQVYLDVVGWDDPDRILKSKPIEEQATILSEQYGFNLKPLASVNTLSKGAEGLFVQPLIKWIAPADCEHPHNYALDFVLERLGESGTFHNHRAGQTGHQYVRQLERTARMWKQFVALQGDGKLTPVLPAQFGLLHRGRSFRRAREVFLEHEFVLGAVRSGVMLLTHLEREQVWKQLHIDCAGGEVSPNADDQFGFSPVFHWNGDKLHFDFYYWTASAHKRYGSPSGFLPQP